MKVFSLCGKILTLYDFLIKLSRAQNKFRTTKSTKNEMQSRKY